MFKTSKFIVFFAAALMLTAGCQIFDSKKAAEPKKTAKSAAVKKDAKAKKKVVKSTKVKKAKKVAKVKKVKKEKKFGGSVPSNYKKENDTSRKHPIAPVAIGFFSPMQFPTEDKIIEGFRFSALYTYNYGVDGLDCGFICNSGDGGTKGLQASLANRTAGPMVGLSLGVINVAEVGITGVQAALYNEAGSNSQDNAAANYDNSYGAQFGGANVANSIFKGAQVGCINISNSIFKGWQIGFINLYDPPSDVFDDFETKEFREMKKKRSCVQIGAFNFNPNGVFPISILVNW